jgi:sugar-specific transcriptional regulator TrmB
MQKNNTTHSQLLMCGLTKREADVYLAILMLGRGTVSRIARQAGINRTTGYDILDSLQHMGLVSLSGKKPKEEYVAESPEALRVMLTDRIVQSKQNLHIAEQCIPKLKEIHAVGTRPKVTFYEGLAGLKAVYEDTLTAQSEIVAFAAYEDMHASLGSYFDTYYARRAARGISIRGIVPDSPLARERITKNVEELRTVAVVPKNIFSITPDIEIYDNKVLIASWRDQLGIIIESEEIAHAMKAVFELAFSEAQRISVLGDMKTAQSYAIEKIV